MLQFEPRTSNCAQNESEKFSTVFHKSAVSSKDFLFLFLFLRSLDVRDEANLFMETTTTTTTRVLSLPVVTLVFSSNTVRIEYRKKCHATKAFIFL